MSPRKTLGSIVCFSFIAAMSSAEHTCVAPVLGDDRIAAIIAEERKVRSDLPLAFPDFTYKVTREGCYYVYVEYAVPQLRGGARIFTLNQYGVIVDAYIGR